MNKTLVGAGVADLMRVARPISKMIHPCGCRQEASAARQVLGLSVSAFRSSHCVLSLFLYGNWLPRVIDSTEQGEATVSSTAQPQSSGASIFTAQFSLTMGL